MSTAVIYAQLAPHNRVKQYLYRRAASDIRANRVRLFHSLGAAVRSGQTVQDSLEFMAMLEREEGRFAHADVLEHMAGNIRRGELTMQQSLAEVITRDDQALFASEEATADLGNLFALAKRNAEQTKAILKAITMPFLLPLYLSLMAIGMAIMGAGILLPDIAPMYSPVHWPITSQALYSVGKSMKYIAVPLALTLGFGISWVIWSLPNLAHPLRYTILDQVFPWSVYKLLKSSTFLMALSALFSAKIAPLQAVSAYGSTATNYTAHYADTIAMNLQRDTHDSDMSAMDVGFIPSTTMHSMRLLGNKLKINEVVHQLGTLEFDLMLDSITRASKRLAFGATIVIVTFLLVSMHATFSVTTSMAANGSKLTGGGR